jgi:hypothetical protein
MDSQLMLAVAGPVTALVFAGAQRAFRAGAQDAAKEQLSEQLRGEFAQFRVDFMQGLNGTFRRTAECQLIESGTAQRLDNIDARLQEVQAYAHERAHTLSGEIQKIIAEAAAGRFCLRRNE